MTRIKFLAGSVFFTFAGLVLAGPESLPSDGKDTKDMKEVAPMTATCDYNWTGFYVGINGGYGWGDAHTHVDPLPQPNFTAAVATTLQPDPDGVIGGGQIGYNWQWHRFVLGAETDFQGSDMGGTDTKGPIHDASGVVSFPDSFYESHERTDWFGTARLRLGFTPFCRLMVYGTGGLAYGHVDYSSDLRFIPSFGYPTSFDKTKAGWTAGGGLEYAITHHWSIKVEYLYYDLGNESATALPTQPDPPFHVHYNWNTTANTVRGGLNFKF